jgi:hypothetical protein
MATTIVTKNSSTAAAVPTAAQLVQGELAVNVADKRLYTEDNGGAIVELGTNPSTLTVTGEITANGGIALGDSDKATFGAGDDLEIYHDGSNSYIRDLGQGNLYITANEFRVGNADNSKDYIHGNNGAEVKLFYNNSPKLATTSTGIDVTGTATMDAAKVETSTTSTVTISENTGSGTAELRFVATDSFPKTKIVTDVSDASLSLETLGNDRLKIANNGDISFYEDTGTTAKLFWDASAEGLNLNGTSGLVIDNSAVNGALSITNPSADLIQFTTGTNDDIAFVLSGSERMRIDSSGNVGIGTDSPSAKLDLSSNNNAGTALNVLRFTDEDGSAGANQPSGKIEFYTTDASSAGVASYISGLVGSGADGRLVFGTGAGGSAAERMRIDSSGNVGIGESSPTAGVKLHVTNATQVNQYLESTGNTTNSILQTGADGNSAYVFNRANAALTFGTNNAERMRIDSSGNLLVGKTASSFTTAGVEIQPSGRIELSRSGELMNLNRLGSDGSLMRFYSSSALVGSIGVTGSGVEFYIDGAYNVNRSGLELGYQAILPRLGQANANGTVNLGDSGRRFKDLYLSGGVYLGGTGAANKLEDYEEGTFTPEVADAATGGNQASGGTFSGRYTKIGNRVFCQISLINIATVGMTATNGIFISGLPFTASSGSNMYSPATILKSAITSTEGTLVGLVNVNTTNMSISNDVSTVTGATTALVSQISSGGGDIYSSFFYETTA